MTPPATRRRAVIIPGYGATPEDHWFGWLADRLRAQDHEVHVVAFPDPLHPQPARWREAVAAAIDPVDERTVVVAHSLGSLTVLRHLRSLRGPWRLGALVLVAGFLEPLPALPELDAFLDGGCEVDGLSSHVDRLAVLRSDSDPLVPIGHTDRLAALLGVAPQVVHGAGHFLGSDGVVTLPEALAAVEVLGSSER